MQSLQEPVKPGSSRAEPLRSGRMHPMPCERIGRFFDEEGENIISGGVSVRSARLFILTAIVLLVIDFLWLGIVMGPFYLHQLKDLGRIAGGVFVPDLAAAALVYILIPLGIILFALPRAKETNTAGSALWWGALFGLVLYGVYDLTNYAMLKDYPLTLTIVDILWGIALCSTISLCAWALDRKLT